MDKGRLQLSELISRFEFYNRSESNAAKTIRWYNQVLGLFLAWLQSEGRSTCLKDLGEDEVRHFIIHLQNRKGVRGKASKDTVNNRVRALRAFFAWLHRQRYTETHRLADVKPPKGSESEIEILNDEEITKIFAAISSKSKLVVRNTAIVSLMLDTGVRLSEVVTLRFENVHLEEQYVKVLGKGNKERMIAFGAKCRKSFSEYINGARVEAPGEWPDVFFRCWDGRPMSTDALDSLMDRTAEASGISRLHAHLLRHTYATRFLMNGGDVFLLKQNLGHTSLAMVEEYVHVASRMAAQMSQQYSPLDGFRSKGRQRHPPIAKGDIPRRVQPSIGRSVFSVRARKRRSPRK